MIMRASQSVFAAVYACAHECFQVFESSVSYVASR